MPTRLAFPPLRSTGRLGRWLALALFAALVPAVISTAQSSDPPADPTPEEPGAPAAAPFALTLDPSAAVVTGLAPGGEALLFSIAREPLGYLTRVSRRDEVVVADETGTAIFVPVTEEGEPVKLPARSVWVAVDLGSGSVATAISEGFEAPRRGVPAGALRRGPSQRIDRLVDRLEEAQIVYVRPGALEVRGIWGLTVMDGSLYDEDATDDGGLEASLGRLFPLLGSGPPPEEALGGDVLVVVDPSTLAFFATRLEL